MYIVIEKDYIINNVLKFEKFNVVYVNVKDLEKISKKKILFAFVDNIYELIVTNNNNIKSYYGDFSHDIIKYHIDLKIGIFDAGQKNNAGILPLVIHKNRLYSLLGISKNNNKFSDFGGSFDDKITPHIKDDFKNNILKDKQIRNDFIDDNILLDHFLNSCDIDYDISKYRKVFDLGDINTKYTAFRELYEESVGFDMNYIFDMKTCYDKLFVSKKYLYLGGDKSYDYDMYVVIFTMDEINNFDLIDIINDYEKNPNLYMSNIEIGRNNFIKIENNCEMKGICLVPMNEILKNVKDINYEIFKKRKKNTDKFKSFHKLKYDSISSNQILNKFRPSFLDALVKYKDSFSKLVDNINILKNRFIYS